MRSILSILFGVGFLFHAVVTFAADRTRRLPDDPGMKQSGALEWIHAPEAWAINTDCSRVLIGIVGNGVDIHHPDLKQNIYRNRGEVPGNGVDDDRDGFVDDIFGWNFWQKSPDVIPSASQPYSWHGTFVAGILGARGNNHLGTAGVCWKARIVIARHRFVDYAHDHSMPQQAADAIEYMVRIQKAESQRAGHFVPMIVNNSYAVFTGASDWKAHGQALKKAIDDANAAGIMLVFAATNGSANNDNPSEAAYPAAYNSPNLIAVAATNADDSLSKISNFGNAVQIAAPGIDLYSTTPGGQYALNVAGPQSFTSFATPLVTGALALYWSLHPHFSAAQVKKALLQSADHVPGLPVLHGNRLNMERLMEMRARH